MNYKAIFLFLTGIMLFLVPSVSATCIVPFAGIQINQSETFCTGNYDLSTAGIAINISANDVTLDCNGSVIYGNGTGTGIDIYASSSTTLKNCIIRDFTFGIYMVYSSSVNLDNSTIYDTSYSAVMIENSTGVDINNMNINNGGYYGVAVDSAIGWNSNVNIENSYINGSTFQGIIAILVDGMVIDNNEISNSGLNDILLGLIYGGNFPCYNSIVKNNHLHDSANGIELYQGENADIYGNTINSEATGILLYNNFNYSTIWDNLLYSNTLMANTGDTGDYLAQHITFNNTLNCSRTNIIGGACSGGNSWDDYTGYDADGNGIGEQTYQVLNTYDYLPLTSNLFSGTISLVSPADSAYTADNTPTFTFGFVSNAPNMSCELFVDSVGYGINSTVYNNTETSLTANASITDGSKTWNIKCTEPYGNSTTSVSRTLTIDTVNPIIEIYSPTSTTYPYTTTSIPLNVYSSDTIDTWTYDLGSGNITFTPNTTISVTDGNSYTIIVYANDTVGHLSSKSVSFSITKAPIIGNYILFSNIIPFFIGVGIVILVLVALLGGFSDSPKEALLQIIGAMLLVIVASYALNILLTM